MMHRRHSWPLHHCQAQRGTTDHARSSSSALGSSSIRPGLTAGLKIGRLPARAFINQVSLHKEVVFNSTATDTISLGTTAAAATDIFGGDRRSYRYRLRQRHRSGLASALS